MAPIFEPKTYMASEAFLISYILVDLSWFPVAKVLPSGFQQQAKE